MSSPGVAAQNSFQGHPSAFEGSVFGYGFNGVLRAGRCVPAGIGQHRAQQQLVEPEEFDQEPFHRAQRSATIFNNPSCMRCCISGKGTGALAI